MSFLHDDPVNHTNVGRIAYYTDQVHDYEFRVEHKNGSTVISPRDPGQRTELKIGILLPFHQTSDNVTRELTISGTSAIRMAAAEINTQQRIPGAYVTLIEKDSFPQALEGQEAITQAVVSAISLVQQGVIGVIGDISSSWTALSALITSTLEIPQCSFTAIASSLADRSQYSYFYRTIPTDLLYADAALSFVASQGWPYISLLYSNDDYGNQLSQYAVMKAKSQGILVNGYQSFYGESDPLHQVSDDIEELLSNPNSRIVFVVAQDEAMTTALVAAANKGYMNSDHVWISLGPLPDTTTIQSSIDGFNAILQSRQQGQTHQQLDWYANSDVASESLQSNQTGNSMRAIDYIAWTTQEYQHPIDYPTAFSGGVFSFALGINLTGYGPFDQLQHTWSQLDPQLYPSAGNASRASSNVAMAYSCLWSMADGFRKIVSGSSNMTQMLNQLVTRQLGDGFTPTAFNTGDNGPDGPMIFNENGDRAVGNFRVLNIQHGQETQIGTIFAGKINLTETPVYYGGSLMVPTGLPAKTCINPGYHTPISLVIVAFTAFGVFMALLAALLITIRRRHLVSNISSLLSCLLELLGFIFIYTSVFFFSADRTLMDCFIIPISFHIGYTLLLGCLSLKLYRIYAVHNNIYLKKPIVTDRQLLRVCFGGLMITGIALVIWLPATEVQTLSVPVTLTTYFVRCDYEGGVHSMLVALITLVAALFLATAVMLAIRTRAIPRNKPKYAECRHISLAIYNIFFSSLIGFTVFHSATDYFTRHYLSASMIVWGATFSLLILYLPKLHTIYIKERARKNVTTGRMSNTRWNNINNHGGGPPPPPSPGPPRAFTSTTGGGDIISINRMLASGAFSSNMPGLTEQKVHQHHRLAAGEYGVDSEAYEAHMPVQVVYRYFPHLSAWDMKHIVLFPRVRYFSFVSEKSHKGCVFHYKEAVIISSSGDEHIIKVRGNGRSDVLIQVARQQELELWCARFNSYCRQDPPPMQSVATTTGTSLTTTSASQLIISDGIEQQHKKDDYSWMLESYHEEYGSASSSG